MLKNEKELASKEAVEAAVAALKAEFSIDEDCGEYGATAVWGTPEEIVQKILEVTGPLIAKGVWQEAYSTGVSDERTSASNIGIAGCVCEQRTCVCKVEPARINPYSGK